MGLAALAWCAAPVIRADEVAGEVTASLDAELGGPIAEGEHLQLGEEGACSILLDDDAVVELCGETSVTFDRDRDSNRRIVSLSRGEIRIVDEARDFEERLEIHTPAVIATLLGTIVHVSVEPSTGATTVSSAESEVSVRSDRPDVRGTTVLAAGEQVTVEPGEPPPATPRRLDPEEIAELGGCLIDFHLAAAGRHSRESGARATERLTAFDAANNSPLPGGPAPDGPRRSLREHAADPLTGQEGVCVATDCDPQRDPGRGKESFPGQYLSVERVN